MDKGNEDISVVHQKRQERTIEQDDAHSRAFTDMPVQVWEDIFGLAIDDIQDEDLVERNRENMKFLATPLAFTHVCRSWRNRVIDMPSLWRKLAVYLFSSNPALQAEMVRTWLARSKASVDIMVYSYKEDSRRNYVRLERFRLPFLDALVEHSDRWRSLHLRVPADALELFEPTSLGADTSVGVLETLILDAFPCLQYPHHLNFGNAIQPKTVDLRGPVSLGVGGRVSVTFQSSKLGTLNVGHLIWTDLLKIVAHSPLLFECRVLRLVGANAINQGTTSGSITSHGALRILEISEDSEQARHLFFDAVCLTSLESLAMSWIGPELVDHLIDMIRRSECSIREIRALQCVVNQKELKQWFEVTIDLEVLELSFNVGSEDDIGSEDGVGFQDYILEQLSSTAPLLRKIRMLTIVCEVHFNWTVLHNFLNCRRSQAEPTTPYCTLKAFVLVLRRRTFSCMSEDFLPKDMIEPLQILNGGLSLTIMAPSHKNFVYQFEDMVDYVEASENHRTVEEAAGRLVGYTSEYFPWPSDPSWDTCSDVQPLSWA